jgi:hypothetical protein
MTEYTRLSQVANDLGAVATASQKVADADREASIRACLARDEAGVIEGIVSEQSVQGYRDLVALIEDPGAWRESLYANARAVEAASQS